MSNTETPIARDPARWAETYRSGDRIVAVHWREDGMVRFHEQTVDQTFVPFSQFFEMNEKKFERQLEKHNAEQVDPTTLPCIKRTE